MANTVKPSTRLLPMDDIAQELQDMYGFSTVDHIAPDTAKVAGVNAELTAVAATDAVTGELVEDRGTVQNALNLGGQPADAFFTKSDGAKIESFGDSVAKVLSDEVRTLRDEFYQMRGELVKQGLIAGYKLYSGFQDLFKTSDIKYEKDYICGIAQDYTGSGINKILPDAPSEFEIGDYFVIKQDADPLDPSVNPITLIVRVIDKDTVSGEITFTPSATGLRKKDTMLFKSLGQYIRGSYSFSAIQDNVVTDKERYTMLNDDTNIAKRSITANRTGYAIQFMIPQTVTGALTKFSVQGRSIGSPGALRCYVINKDFVSSFRNPNQAAAAGKLVAVSDPVPSTLATSTGMIDFIFNPDPTTGKYPVLDRQEYVFIIEALTANTSGDYWEISFSYHRDDLGNMVDLQTNNVDYEFTEIADTDPDMTKLALANTLDMKKLDMYFILTTKEIAEEVESPYREGLYSAKFELPAPIEVSRARLTMRISREGLFEVSSDTGAYPDETLMYIRKNGGDYDMSQESGIAINEPVVIGTNIRKFENINSTQMTLGQGQGIYLTQGDQVYRMGYTVQLKAKRKVWDTVTCAYVESSKELIDLPLVAAIPDGSKLTPFYSDRLIFEQNLNQDPNAPAEYFNEFEVQIKWNSNFSLSTLSKFSNDLIGRIFSMTLSFDKSL